MPPRLIDIGINLTDPMFRGYYHGKQVHEDDLQQVLLRAQRAGVDRMIVTAGNLADCREALDLVRDQDYDRLHFCPKETQLRFFERQFELAELTRLPMFLHNRNTGSDFGKLISQNRSRFIHGVVHSFTGTMEELQHYLDLGLYIGINGCSLKTEENLKVAASVPLDKLMLETDGPWCDIRPTHASYKHLSSMSAKYQALYNPPAKKKERFEMGSAVKSRNEPCTMG
ncbi:TatD DNase [Mortierella claussenii]|nr:TatD DNase [Mortierella claussenii]